MKKIFYHFPFFTPLSRPEKKGQTDESRMGLTDMFSADRTQMNKFLLRHKLYALRYFFIFFLPFVFGCLSGHSVKSQQSPYDSLRKYSYYVVGFKNMGNGLAAPGSGTGYFIRRNNNLFFLTAKHVFIGCDNKDTCKREVKRKDFPESMDIKLTTNGIINGNIIPISIKKFRDTANCPWTDPDIIAYQVMNTPTDTIYSLEKLLKNKLPDNKGLISIYGYPAAATILPDGSYLEQNSSHIPIDKYFLYENYKYKACGGKEAIDKDDYIVKTEGINTVGLGGYSGSPVFILDKETLQWSFIGTFIGAVETDNKFRFLIPKHTISATKNPIH